MVCGDSSSLVQLLFISEGVEVYVATVTELDSYIRTDGKAMSSCAYLPKELSGGLRSRV